MTVETLIAQFGYWFVFAGALLEGETVVVLAGFLAHQGHLQLGAVIALAVLGSWIADQAWFHVGRRYGRPLLARYPRWARRSDWIGGFIRRRPDLFVLSFRFIYGIRTIGPVLIALAGVSPWRFLVLNALAAVVWGTVIPIIGYVFGAAVELVLGKIHAIEMKLFAGLAVALVLYLVSHGVVALWRRRETSREEPPRD